jgi:hypothetical protein
LTTAAENVTFCFAVEFAQVGAGKPAGAAGSACVSVLLQEAALTDNPLAGSAWKIAVAVA